MSFQQKQELFEKAFLKALDASVNSIGEGDLQECFGDLKVQFGASLQKNFVNMISKTSEKIEQSFHEITNNYELFDASSTIEAMEESFLDKSSIAMSVVEPLPVEQDDKMADILNTLKRGEIEELKRSIRVIEAEIKKSKDQAGRLKTQLLNEVDAINLENLKIKHATEQFDLR
jgi:hypothetical protein